VINLKKSLIIILILIFVIPYTIWIIRDKNKFKVPEIQDIQAITLIPSRVGGKERVQLVFDFNNKDHLQEAEKILLWVKSARIVGNTERVISQGGTPTQLILRLKNNRDMVLTIGSHAFYDEIRRGIEVKEEYIKSAVAVDMDNIKKPIIILSPELQQFISSGWKKVFNYN
jgi:hypothetical protein